MSPARWITLPPRAARLPFRLFCFPHAGGGASFFRQWWRSLPGIVEVCPVQLPGREERLAEAPFTRLEPLLDALAEAIVPFLDVPYALFGHSNGALIGFELTRLLRRRGVRPPSLLFVSACAAPDWPDPDPPLHELSNPALISNLRGFRGTPPEFFEDPEVMELLLPAVRADLEVNETYEYSHELPLECPITVLGGRDDTKTDRRALDAWCTHTSRECNVHVFAGGHFYLKTDQTAALVVVSTELSRVLPTSLPATPDSGIRSPP